ncbi:hypothetical protein OIU77_001935 [Salix suchowensis]|uniref:Uncharacterized protein n=2 Tax=Salix TaxID=40685 RepID=A0A9Q0PN89_9ROSI|nr:hypothetical protein OIU77_001935 [Salix suchowensis]KAJ6691433.1 hypothetical protein OIU74_016021 [Salix koriyanagi]
MAACPHATPSTEGISSLYIPSLFVVLFTENDICSLVLGQLALNLQSNLTSAPGSSCAWRNCCWSRYHNKQYPLQ